MNLSAKVILILWMQRQHKIGETKELAIIEKGSETYIFEKGSETYIFDETLHNKTKTLKSTKMAFYIPHLNQTGLLGIQTDITELQELKKQAAKHKS